MNTFSKTPRSNFPFLSGSKNLYSKHGSNKIFVLGIYAKTNDRMSEEIQFKSRFKKYLVVYHFPNKHGGCNNVFTTLYNDEILR